MSTEVQLSTLDELAGQLAVVDKQLISLLAVRTSLARQVVEKKYQDGLPIFRPSAEEERLDRIGGWATDEGLDRNFARTLLYLIIGESCKQQIIHLQGLQKEQPAYQDKAAWYEKLKQNLLILTERWAPVYDEQYDRLYPAIRLCLDLERERISSLVTSLPDQELMVDLGCATGRRTIRFGRSFDQAIGYDLSPHMIAAAEQKAGDGNRAKIHFEVLDVENGLPLEDHSVSFVMMNMGTGSDVRNITGVITETARVLKPEGKFFFSFYNKEAMRYRRFLPWITGLAAEINPHKNCLDVHCLKEILSIFAMPYTVSEAIALFTQPLQVDETMTHPVVSSILPKEMLQDEVALGSIKRIDHELAFDHVNLGAYIMVEGTKTS